MTALEATSLTRRTTLISAACAVLLLGAVLLVDGNVRSRAAGVPSTLQHASATSDDPPARATSKGSGPKEIVVVTARNPRERAAQSQKRLARARSLGAQGSVVVNPCVVPLQSATSSNTCERTALAPFFRALDALEQQKLGRGQAEKHASVAVLGNSLIAADHIIDVIRLRLVERFGDGGRGFVLADRIADYGTRTRTGQASVGRWTAHNFSMGERGEYPFGVAGVLHVSKGRGSRTAWRLFGEERARVFLYEHDKSPAVRVLIDDVTAKSHSPGTDSGVRMLDLSLPPDASSLVLEADGQDAVVYGAILERAAPGVVVNSFGVPAADAAHFLSADPTIFSSQLTAQDPSLVVVMLGGNETKRLHWGKRRRGDVEESYGALLDRLHEVVPGAACLAVGPIDSVYGGSEKVWRTRAHLGWVIEMQKRVAAEKGCAYFDLFDAMGGAGSLRRFASQGLLHEDMVHPKQGGLDMLGELVSDALLDAYEATPLVERVPAGARSATSANAPRSASDG